MKGENLIKEHENGLMPAKEPKKISKWKMFKAMVSAGWEDFKSHMKKGGWKKGAVLGTAVAVVPIVLVGCVEQTQAVEVNIQDKKFFSAQEIQNFLGDEYSLNQTIKEAVEDYAKESYGQNAKVLSVVAKGNDLFGGNIYAMIENEGKVFALEIQNNLSASQFDAKVYKKDTFSFENNILKFTQDGKDKEVNLEVDGIAYVYNSETGDLTTVETSDFENAISGAVKSAVEIHAVLSNGLDANQESDFKFVLGQIYAENVKAQFPGIEIDYNASKDKTIVRADFAKTDGTIEKITVEFDGFVKDGENLNQEEALKQFETEKAVVSSETVEVVKEYLQIYVSGDKAYSVEFVVDEPEQGGETEENIEFSSWSDVFNVFGEENTDIVKNAFNEILKTKLFNEDDIKLYFGNSMTIDDLDNGKIEVLKWAFETDENNNITAVQVMAQRNGYTTENDKKVAGIQFNLTNTISFDSIVGKKNVENIIASDYILINGDTSLDISTFAEDLDLSTSNRINPFEYTPATDDYDLKTCSLLISQVADIGDYDAGQAGVVCSVNNGSIFVEIKVYNDKTNSYEMWSFVVDGSSLPSGDLTSKDYFEGIQTGMETSCKSSIKGNRQMISSSGYIFAMNEKQEFEKINLEDGYEME